MMSKEAELFKMLLELSEGSYCLFVFFYATGSLSLEDKEIMEAMLAFVED